jgi:hypothetical protein
MTSILDNKNTSAPSVFLPAALLREARRQKGTRRARCVAAVRMAEHVQAKACPGLDPGWTPARRPNMRPRKRKTRRGCLTIGLKGYASGAGCPAFAGHDNPCVIVCIFKCRRPRRRAIQKARRAEGGAAWEHHKSHTGRAEVGPCLTAAAPEGRSRNAVRVDCRYVATRTTAATVIAAACAGGSMRPPRCWR